MLDTDDLNQKSLEAALAQLSAERDALRDELARASAAIAEQRQAEAELSAAKRNLQGVLDSATSGIVAAQAVRDAQGRIVDFRFTLANPMSERMLFRTASEMIGRTLLELFPGNVESGLFERYVHVTETGEPIEVETFYHDARLEFWLNVSAVRVDDGVAITFTDITHRKQTEREIEKRSSELAREKAFAERIIANVNTGVCYLDRELIFRVANPVYCNFLQMPREQILDRYLFDVVPGGEETILPIFRAALDEARPHYVEALPFAYYTPEGHKRMTYWDATYLPMKRAADGEVEGVLVLANEVTERIENQRWQRERMATLQQIAAQREFAERVLNNVPAGVAYLDRELVFRFSNPVYAHFIDKQPEQIVGRYLDDVLPGAVEQTGPWLHQVMATGQPFENTNYRLTTYESGGRERYSYWDFIYYPD
ncbi:MAG TPA: PAS domain-containing protein, partial [Oscillatoriaceae cyanobacterium]